MTIQIPQTRQQKEFEQFAQMLLKLMTDFTEKERYQVLNKAIDIANKRRETK